MDDLDRGPSNDTFCAHDPLLGCTCPRAPRPAHPLYELVAVAGTVILTLVAAAWAEAGAVPGPVRLDSGHVELHDEGAADVGRDDPAPAAVTRLAARHGGSPVSPWVAPGCEPVLELVRRHGLPDWMVSVAWRESRCRPEAVNLDRSTADESYGLFQINTLGRLIEEARRRCGIDRPDELLDADTNVACAATLYDAYGYRPWNSGTYFS
jgi:hypothetical protein